MSWSTEEVMKFTTQNEKALAEVNATLTPESSLNGQKVGVFIFGQAGDLATATAVLKYRHEIFHGKQIVWFVNHPNCDILKYAPISEIRPWPWAGNGLPIGTKDFWPLLCNEYNRLNLSLAKEYELTEDLSDGFFPAPYMYTAINRHGVEYPNVSKKNFDVPYDWQWHPYLSWSLEERKITSDFMEALPVNRKNIMLETFCGSGQSAHWDKNVTIKIMSLCREILGECNFIFASHKHNGGLNNVGIDNSLFFDDIGCISAAHFSVRQCALLNDYCSLFVGMSSGLSVSTSAWGLKPTIKLQYCGSKICSTVALANGEINLVTTDGKTKDQSNTEFYLRLIKILNSLK